MASLTSPSPAPTSPPPIPLVLAALVEARAAFPPDQFRSLLRTALLTRPEITLEQAAIALGVSRQRVGKLAGPLARPTCAEPGPRPAPAQEAVRERLGELVRLVREGNSVPVAARLLGLSPPAAAHFGFRVRAVRPVHGSTERAASGCACWRCRAARAKEQVAAEVANSASKDS